VDYGQLKQSINILLTYFPSRGACALIRGSRDRDALPGHRERWRSSDASNRTENDLRVDLSPRFSPETRVLLSDGGDAISADAAATRFAAPGSQEE
jgi:hypothetical protein